MSIHPIAATVLFMLLGMLIYFIDSQFGVGLSRWWYNLTHKDPRPANVKMGFISGHRSRRKLVAGMVIGLIGLGLQLFFFEKQLLSTVLLETTALLVGITLGLFLAPVVLRFLPGQIEAATDYVDKVESGETDVREDIAGAASTIKDKVTDAATGGLGKAGDVIKNIREEVQEISQDIGNEVKDRIGGDKEGAATDTSTQDSPDDSGDSNDSEDGGEDKDWRKGVKKFLDK